MIRNAFNIHSNLGDLVAATLDEQSTFSKNQDFLTRAENLFGQSPAPRIEAGISIDIT